MDNFNRSGNWFIDQLNVFQSANSDDISIKYNFIVRKDEFERIIEGLKNKKSGDPLQHELILGRRGSGKSTLLKRIEIEIKENTELNNSYIAINLAEEQAGIYRLFDLWEEVINELRQILHIDIQLLEFETFKTNHEYTRYLYQNIHNICQEHKKRIVLLLDNFDRIVENFTDDGSLLRETLINYNDIQLIAGSTRMDEHFWRYDMPFYEFFRTHRLESLSRTEIETLLTHWSESLSIPELKFFVKNNPGKLENIRILTDGLPRTIQFFVQIVLQKKESDTYEYLKKIMDNVTPLYQERLNHLPAQMRKTILEMAFIWEACTTKQLVERIRMESKLISANLTTLVEKGVVDKIETGKKQHLYRISERFFNMWLIITQGNPEQKRKAKWLSIFLESWYDEHDFKDLVTNHLLKLRTGELNGNEALVISKALSQSKYISLAERDSIIYLTEQIDESKQGLLILPIQSKELIDKIDLLINQEDYKNAIELINAIENEGDGIKFYYLGHCYYKIKNYKESEKYFSKAKHKGINEALNYLGSIFYELNDYEKANDYYLKAIDEKVYSAYNNLGILNEEREEFSLAEEYYKKAIGTGNKDAVMNIGLLFINQKKYKEAEKYLLMAENLKDDRAFTQLGLIYYNTNQFTKAEKYLNLSIKQNNLYDINNLGLTFEKLLKFEEAETTYLKAIVIGDFIAFFNLGLLYEKQNNFEKSIICYKSAIEKGINIAIINLASLYFKLGQNVDAESYYKLAIEKDQENAYNELAKFYDLNKNYREAEKYYSIAIEKGQKDALFHLAILYAQQLKLDKAAELLLLSIENGNNEALFILAYTYSVLGRLEDAEKYYLRAIEIGNTDALIHLASFYHNKENYKEAEKYYHLSIKSGNISGYNDLSYMYYQTNSNKSQALEYINKACSLNPNPTFKETQIIIEVWNGIFKDIEKRVVDVIKEKELENIEDLIQDLLIQQQKTIVLTLFHHAKIGKSLQDKYMVLYYVTLIINNQLENNLLLRIPPELQTTIDDVIAKIKERQKIYGNN